MTIEHFIQQLGITEEALKIELQSKAMLSRHSQGTFLIKNNQFIKVLKIVLSGKVRVYQEQEGREILIYYLNPIETCTLSLSACFENCKSTVNAIAQTDCIILNIPIRFVQDWTFKYRSWNNFTINTYKESYRVLLDSYAKLAFYPLKERLWDYLKEEARELLLNRSHQQISKELGTTREVVSRLLKKLELEGKIQLGQKEIKILL